MSRLTEHFTRAELACHCGCDAMPFTEEALRVLEGLRAIYGKPMVISSGYRCAEHNARVSSTGENGPHTRFEDDNVTVDVRVYGADALNLIDCALRWQRWSGIGVQQRGPHGGRFVHLDRLPDAPGQPRPWIWSYAR